MPELLEAFVLLRGVLNTADIQFLVDTCKERLDRDGIPCFALIDHLKSPTYLKIFTAISQMIGEKLHYLNDFYIYTDESFKTQWHMDTELFTFESAVNAWILLSPGRVNGPISFIADVNADPAKHYHSVRFDGENATFLNFRNRQSEVRSTAEIEANRKRTPAVEVGDILVINPKLFHRTEIDAPKHAFAMKMVYGGNGKKGCLASKQVPSMFWPEVKTFNDVMDAAPTWEAFTDGIRQRLRTEDGRRKLSSGFYPEKFEFYREKIKLL